MKTHKHVLLITLLTAFLASFSSLGSAAGHQAYSSSMGYGERTHCSYIGSGQQSYGSKIGHKALQGITNLTLSPLEIPKNIINTTNDSNVFYGIFGGLFKGLVHTAGRMSAGLLDLITFPLPTHPITNPLYPWQEYFDRDTTYCDIFDLNFAEETAQPLAPMPLAQPATAPVVVSPKANVEDHTDQYREETDRTLNKLFKKEMLK
jgi:putative exosortase-associated protein (TIGR04073 family)